MDQLILFDNHWDYYWSLAQKNGWAEDPCKKCIFRALHRCAVMIETNFTFNRLGAVLNFSGCNLYCKFCYGENVSHLRNLEIKTQEVLHQIQCKRHTFQLVQDRMIVRLTGQEPTLQWENICWLLHELNKCGHYIIEIDTNGIFFSGDSNYIKFFNSCSNIDFIINVSFKGVNEKQFRWLTGCPETLFEKQCRGFYNLVHRHTVNVTVNPVIGIYHNDNPTRSVAIQDENGEIMDFDDYDLFFRNLVVEPYQSISGNKFKPDFNCFVMFNEIDTNKAKEILKQ